MITKLNYTAIVCLFLIGCSSPDSNPSNSEASPNPPPTQISDINNVKHNSLASAKKAFTTGCKNGGGTEQYCSCQFKVINASLSKSIGKKWYAKDNIAVEDNEKYALAGEQSIKQCKKYDSINEQTKSTNSSLQYDAHYTGKFSTMQECLSSLRTEAKKDGMSLEISTDKPDEVTGSFNGNADWFFYCKVQETGTEGTYYEGAVPKFK